MSPTACTHPPSLSMQFRSPFPKLQSLPSSSPPRKLTLSGGFSRTQTSSTYKSLSVKCTYSDYLEQHNFNRNDYGSRPGGGGGLPPKVFVGHSIYKGKAAMTVTPSPPKFAMLESGAYKVSKEGCILLQFAPAASLRQYDWNRKQVFSLSVAEMGKFMCLDGAGSLDFLHDPFMGKSDEGKVRKQLRIEPLTDRTGHLFNLSIQDRIINVDESISIPVSRAELAVLTSLFNYAIPYFLGWHTFANSITPEDSNRVNNAGDFEWSR